MKKIILISNLIAFGLLLHTQAAPLAGCDKIMPPGTWSEFLQNGQPGLAGNQITAQGPNYLFAGAQITFVTNDVTGEWDWLTKYEGGQLFLTNAAGAPWFNECAGAETYEVDFPEVWVKTRSTRYAETNAGYLEFLLSGHTDSFRIKATYAGTPAYTQETNGVLASDALATARICIGNVVKVDVMPKPLQVKSKGALPAAIFGSRDFDVKTIDPATLKLECVSPLRWVYSKGPCRGGKLLLKFDRQAIVANLPPVENREKVSLVLTGTLKDGTPISGSDEVIILDKSKPSKPAKPGKK